MLEMDIPLGSRIASEQAHDAVIFLLATISMLLIGIVVQIVIYRLILNRRTRQKNGFLSAWRPVMALTLISMPEKFPSLPAKYLSDFASEWNGLYESLVGPARQSLVEMAITVNAHLMLRELLISPQPRKRLLAVVTLGNMKDKGVWKILEALARNDRGIISLAAFRALMQIDPDLAIGKFSSLLVERHDWQQSMLAKILKESGSKVVCHALTDLALITRRESVSRVLSLLGVVKCESSGMIARTLLRKYDDPGVIVGCFKISRDPALVEYARKYVKHELVFVRINACVLLGKIGTRDDIPILLERIGDREWWVRYRAAQALVGLPYLSRDELNKIRNDMDDRYAKDILDQVFAEHHLT